MFKPLDYQIEMAKQGYAVLKQYGIVYLAGEERVRKTLPAIMITNMCSNVKHVLVITMKEPIKGWKHHLSNYNTNAIFTVCNFHSAHKYLDLEPDLVIIDEAHNINDLSGIAMLLRNIATTLDVNGLGKVSFLIIG